MTDIKGTWYLAIVNAFDEDSDAFKMISVAPVDGTYLGDIKFGESLPAGPNAIGKLVANPGVLIGNVGVTSVTLPTAFFHGQKTVTTHGTEEALAASQALVSGVHIKALAANTGDVYVGANPVTSTTGYVLAGGESVFLEIADLATVYIDTAVDGEGVSYIGS